MGKTIESKELVHKVFKGEGAPRIPIYFLLADVEAESKVNDVLGIPCWFKAFDLFFEQGGPFRRGETTFSEWAEKLDLDMYDWPPIETLREEAITKVEQIVNRFRDKFTQVEFLGPTEYSEILCAPGGKQVKDVSLIRHHFDFAVLTKIASEKADDLHRRLFEIVKDVAGGVAECDGVDSIRIADDFCDYRGPLYHSSFLERSILPRQIELARMIKRHGKYAVLHADGDITAYLKRLSSYYDAFHPLDLRPKPTLRDAKAWAEDVGRLRRNYPDKVFITGVPIDLLCSREIAPAELVDAVRYFLSKVGREKLILANTHRPYPGWALQDFIDKVQAVRNLIAFS
jgi:hypothetical protein